MPNRAFEWTGNQLIGPTPHTLCLPLKASVRWIGNPGGGAFGGLSSRPRSVAAGRWNPGRPESSGPPAEGPGTAPGSSLFLRRVQAARLQHPCELVNRAATHGVHLEARHHLPLQSPGLAKLVQRDRVDRQLMRDRGHSGVPWSGVTREDQPRLRRG